MRTLIAHALVIGGLAACTNGAGGGAGGAGGSGGESPTTTAPSTGTTAPTTGVGGSQPGTGGGETTGTGGNGSGGDPGPMCDGAGGDYWSECKGYEIQFCEVKAALGCTEEGAQDLPCYDDPVTCPDEYNALYACLAAATTTEACECGNDGEGGAIDHGAMYCGNPCGTERSALNDCLDPEFVPPENCELESVVVIPSELSPTDGCEASYTCDEGVEVLVECDGENDGTNTSLCTCDIGNDRFDAGLVEGEGEDACLAGFENCLAATESIDPGD